MRIVYPTDKMVAYLRRLLYTRDVPAETRATIQAQMAAGTLSHYRCSEWIVHLKDLPRKPRP